MPNPTPNEPPPSPAAAGSAAHATPSPSAPSTSPEPLTRAAPERPAAVDPMAKGAEASADGPGRVDLTVDRAAETTPIVLRGGRRDQTTPAPAPADGRPQAPASQPLAWSAEAAAIHERVLGERLTAAIEEAILRVLPAALEAARTAAQQAPLDAPADTSADVTLAVATGPARAKVIDPSSGLV